MSDVPLLTTVDEMLRIAELQLAAIRFDHLSIDLIDNAPQAGVDRDDSESTPIEINCNLGTRQEGKEFGARFEFHFKAAQWQAVIAVITDYADFASKVALMAAIPFVREALSGLTARVTGTAVLLPLIRSGEITFAPNM